MATVFHVIQKTKKKSLEYFFKVCRQVQLKWSHTFFFLFFFFFSSLFFFFSLRCVSVSESVCIFVACFKFYVPVADRQAKMKNNWTMCR